MRKIILLQALLSVIFCTAWIDKSVDFDNKFNEAIIQNTEKNEEPIIPNKNPIIEKSSLVNDANKEKLNKIGKYELESQKDNSIDMSRFLLERKEYFLALTARAEGFQSKIYKDNKGIALGFGWNLTQQSPEYNKELAKAIFYDISYINTISNASKFSNKKISERTKSQIEISPQKSLQIAYLMGEDLRENVVIKSFASYLKKKTKDEAIALEKARDLFSRLSENQQAALIYHAYKIGAYGFLNSNNLIRKIVAFMDNKKIEIKDIAVEFNYTYMKDGNKINDWRANEVVRAMFIGPHKFALLLNKDTNL